MNLIITKELIDTLPRTHCPLEAALKEAVPAGVSIRREFNDLGLYTDEVEFWYEMPEYLMDWLMAWHEGEAVDPINWEVPCCPDDLPKLEATAAVRCRSCGRVSEDGSGLCNRCEEAGR